MVRSHLKNGSATSPRADQTIINKLDPGVFFDDPIQQPSIMKHTSSISFIAGAMALGLASSAMAINSHYAPGDLVLTFQKVGSTNTVYVDLGNAATVYRGSAAGAADGTNSINFLDLSTTLTSAFGAGWASDPDIYAGLAGVYSTNSTNSTLVNGDPSRTLYVSAARTDVGTVGTASSTAWNVGGTSAMTTAAGGIQSQNNIFGDIGTNPANGYDSQIIVSPTSASSIDEQQPITVFQGNNTQGVAFGVFDGGIQQAGAAGTFGTFGTAGSVEFALDLYRILAKTGISGQVGSDLRTGTYEGTITIGTNGMVSFVAKGTVTSSSFQTWAQSFSAVLDTPEKQLPSADPDGDGLSNLMEFVLNGNPGISDNPSIVPALTATSTDFVFSFNRRDDSEADNTLLFQYGSDLTGWTDVAIGASGGTVGSATVAITENTTDPDAISVTVPKTSAVGNKLFGRLKVTNP